MDNGVVTRLDDGVPQGGPVSPVLANIYLHYVFDLWFERRFKKTCRGFAELTRFADDFVATFRNRDDAERFRREMEERLVAFGLRIAPEKTAVRHFDGSLLQGGHGSTPTRPETFTFLWLRPFPYEDASGRCERSAETERQGARALCQQREAVAQSEFGSAGSRPTGPSENDAPGLLPVLRALLLHARPERRAEPGREVLAAGSAAEESEGPAAHRLADPKQPILVQTPITETDGEVGVTAKTARTPICSGEPDAGNLHVGF
jgi:hypothetical protein